MKKDRKDEICKECGCSYKTKYMIRVDYDNRDNDNKNKSHWEATSKRSVVGWIKFICNEFGNFEEIQIYNLMTECRGHEAFYDKKKNPTLQKFIK